MNTAGLTLLAEGKTKAIFADPDNPDHEVLIVSKDDITAGDGAKRDSLPGKGALATRTTCNCFLRIETDACTHFRERVDDITFRAHRVSMIPLELVARRIAYGSYLKRNPDVAENTRFEKPILECFLKDDARNDPFVIPDPFGRELHLFHPKKPLAAGYIQSVQPDWLLQDRRFFDETIEVLCELLTTSFTALETAWAEQDVTLVDLKIECGWTTRGVLVVADVIDNDSWRIWPQGEKEKMLDKQVYRDLPESTPEGLREILANYQAVADATDKF